MSLDWSSLVSISGNSVQNSGYTAIELWGSSNVTVEDNILVKSGEQGIELWSMSETDIRSNIVNNNGGVGILILESGFHSKIINNTVNRNDGGGINITSSDDTLVAGNTLNSNKGYGISLTCSVEVEGFEGVDAGAASSNELIENFITASTNAAEVYIGEECGATVLKGNLAADNEDDQLLIDNRSPMTLISSDNVPNFVSSI